MVSADIMSDENVAKGKREAPMAEPSTDYTPPRLEAPYATYSPITGGNVPQPIYYQQSRTPFNQGPSAPPYEYNRYTGVIPLPTVDNNDLGNGLNPGPPYNPNGNYNGGNGYGGTAPNSYGNFPKYNQNQPINYPTSYAQLNGLGPSLTVYGAGAGGNVYDNNAGNNNQYAGGRSPFSNAANSGNYENSFYGNPSFGGGDKYPTTGALVSNEPSYASRGLRHYSQPPLNTQTLKNSRPIALTPPHLTRKQPSFLTDQRNPNFRPSFLLGSSVVSSTPDYNIGQGGATLTSLGETSNQYIFPNQGIQEQYAAPPSIGSLPLAQPNYENNNNYQSPDNFGQNPPSTSYGLPETIIYTKSSLFGERYGAGPQSKH